MYIYVLQQGPRSSFRELDAKAPIRQQLSNLVILEYAVIYVFLPSHNFDFEVVKEANPVTLKTKYKDSGSNPSPMWKGYRTKNRYKIVIFVIKLLGCLLQRSKRLSLNVEAFCQPSRLFRYFGLDKQNPRVIKQ